MSIEPGRVIAGETRVPIARWPAELGPLRIAALADLHTGAPLVLAGHTHGGQVNLPVFGRLIVPSRYGERYAIGHVHENDRDLFVSPGIGIIPLPFRVPPEISLLTVGR